MISGWAKLCPGPGIRFLSLEFGPAPRSGDGRARLWRGPGFLFSYLAARFSILGRPLGHATAQPGYGAARDLVFRFSISNHQKINDFFT